MPDVKLPSEVQADKIDLLDAYLAEDLSSEESRQLEAELGDPDFNAEWQSLLDLHNSLPNLGRDIMGEPIPGRWLRIILQGTRGQH